MAVNLKPVTMAVVALFVSGCALMPGAHISTSQGWYVDEEASPASSLPEEVRVRPITAGVLEESSAVARVSLPPQELLEEPAGYEYRIGIGDVLQITVWDHPELTIPAGSMRSPSESGNWVHNDGHIFYPYVGRIKVEGLRVTEIRDLIAERISEYIENPQVDVTVAAFRSQRVYVTGAVTQPGAYPVTNVPMRLLDAVNKAGGISEHSDWSRVTLSRGEQEYQLSLRAVYQQGNPAHNVLLMPGDVLHVGYNDDNKVFVLGEVRQARSVPMTRNGLSLAEVISESGGLDRSVADASGIFVMRRAPEGSEHKVDLFQLNARDATAFILADAFAMQSRDVVYVTAAPIARWNRVINNILPTVQSLYFGARAFDRVRSIND